MAKISFLSPLPPARTGVAHYAAMLLPALRKRFDVTAFGSLEGYRAEDFDVAIYQLGNNPSHEFVLEEAMRRPGIAVLHDVVLHHLIVEMTLARGDADAYVAALEENHGEAGAAWARGRAAGLHSEMGNFLLPASVEVARRSRAVLVHNQWARDRLLSFGVTTPIHVVPHPFVDEPLSAAPVRGHRERVIGLFGFLTSAKRGEVVLEAFRRARERNPNLRLLIVGEPAPNIQMPSGEGITVTGYVADDDFGRYYAEADRLVNLRYPSAGETSGTLIRALAAGKPVAVSDYAQFAEFPDDVVVKIPFGEDEVSKLVSFFLDDLPDPSAAQRRWLEENATLDRAVQGYAEAIDAASLGARVSSPAQRAGEDTRPPMNHAVANIPYGLPIFPRIGVTAEVRDGHILLTLQNHGDTTIQTRVYGQPGYRIVVNGRWIELPSDLPPGGSVTLDLPHDGGSIHIDHALQGIPVVR